MGRLDVGDFLVKWRIEHERLEKRLVFGRAISKQRGGFAAVSRAPSSRKWTNRKAIGGEKDGACPNCTGDMFHWLNIRRRRKRDVEASTSREHFVYRVGSL